MLKFLRRNQPCSQGCGVGSTITVVPSLGNAAPGAHLAESGNIFGCHDLGVGWVATGI